MNIQPLEFSAGASTEAIARLEVSLGRTLPHDYRTFLGQFDGSEPIQPPCVPVPNNNTDVQVIYGISDNLPDYARMDHFFGPGNEKSESRIPIANDSGGNMFWLSLADEDFGKVYFEDRDWIPGSGLVADSWSHFLQLINEGVSS
jgi:cell wall assembly regulator SMI1